MSKQAQQFAISKHGNQKYGEHPYSYHLNYVVNILTEYGYAEDDAIVSAGWLHDTIEDTDTTHTVLVLEFGKEIADIVWAVSSEPGENRPAKFRNTAPKIISNKKALVVKLADRIANTEASLANNPKLYQMYVKEFTLFHELLYQDNLPMWERLIKLCQG
ncbi:HD domain-containing protein [Anabaena sp. UHCC 0187]|uniref:HD domain-containing protein n=1 Tax=Anabaena sp. UHCC 0187 TaxID=2590018 RepID=UPI001C2BC27C|nr:HD domain-containing protein [Anabaena sp. UHCC 0187]